MIRFPATAIDDLDREVDHVLSYDPDTMTWTAYPVVLGMCARLLDEFTTTVGGVVGSDVDPASGEYYADVLRNEIVPHPARPESQRPSWRSAAIEWA